MNKKTEYPLVQEQLAVAGALAYESARVPARECSVTMRNLLTKLAEFHMEHNGLDLFHKVEEFVDQALQCNKSVQQLIDDYAFENHLY